MFDIADEFFDRMMALDPPGWEPYEKRWEKKREPGFEEVETEDIEEHMNYDWRYSKTYAKYG